jgi:hypothetical protein
MTVLEEIPTGKHYEIWKLLGQHANISFISDDMRKIE